MTAQAAPRFTPSGILALDPKAFGIELLIAPALPPAPPFTLECDGKVAVVDVRGPLAFAGWQCDTYDNIRARVTAALASDAQTVVLRIDSPGGEVAGAFDLARWLRQAARAAGKSLLAHTAHQACSSGYALASAADRISASDTATVGSIGVISALVDTTRADQAMGLRFAIVASGARKADGNPHVPLTDETLAAVQSAVNDTAEIFFSLVREHRPNITDPVSLEAASFIAARALPLGLIDAIESWDACLAVAASPLWGRDPTMRSQAQNATESTMPDDDKKDEKDAVRASLAKAAEDKDEKKAARAKRALAAYDESEDKEAADDEPKKDAKSARADEDSDDFKKKDARASDEKKDDTESRAIAALSSALNESRAQTQALTKRLDDQERAAIFASRPDLPPELVKELANAPIDQVRRIVAAVPQGRAGFVNPHAPPAAPGTQGARAADADRLSAEAAAELDRKMGLGEQEVVCELDPTGTVFRMGVTRPKAASSAAPKG